MIEIKNYSPEYKEAFRKLNTEWLEKYFYVEPYDEAQLSEPEKIIVNGGFIYFAELDGEVVGTASLFRQDDNVFELAKMAVTESAKGKGIGKLLMKHCLNEARSKGAKKVFLDSNRSLIPAISMYKVFGFKEIPMNPDNHYERADIKMELTFKP